ncbi:MAG: aspartate ammonia-lyase [Bacillota bacterium]|jgi:aspartate ammonia-lyase|nr:aspartate ammonia-lyase [Clostridia bacterium]
MTKYRVERDFLGEMQVPAERYYGCQTARALVNFPITGLKLDEDFVKAMGMVKYAAAEANMALGLLPEKIGKAIMEASLAVVNGELSDEFPVDPIQGGAGTSANMNVNEVIANKAAEILGGNKGDYKLVSPNTHVNMAQSTNDVIPTSIRLAALMKSQKLAKVSEDLVKALRDKEKEFDGILKMGRTHLQDAVPIRLGQEFGAWAQAVERGYRRMVNAANTLLTVNLGATAIGTALNADPEYLKMAVKNLAKISKFNFTLAENLIDATQFTDALAEVSDSLKTYALTLSKIANDLRLLASGPKCGLKEINLPEVQPGSSIMPSKVNPVMAEVVNQVAFQVIGNNLTVSLAVEAGQLELNVMEPVMAYNLFQSFDILSNVLKVFRERCIEGITANVDNCRAMVDRSVGVVTALNPHIGYENACSIAKEAFKTGRSVRDVCLERGILSEEHINIILDPKEMTEPGIAGKELLKVKEKIS